MPIAAIALILFAAVMHAGYNFFAKASRDTIAFLWWAVALGAAMYGLGLVASGNRVYLASESLVFFFISGAAEIGYFYALVRGYAQGDLSLVYPLSRGSAPLFVTLWSAIALAERLPFLGYLGIGLMIAGVYIASLTANGAGATFGWHTLWSPFRNHAARWALASAVFIAIYSLSDREAIKATPPLVYNFWVYLGNTITWSFIVWPRRRIAQNMQELKANLPRLMASAVMTIGAYALILVAQTMTSTSYVVAGRGTSVVIGALLGTMVLKEGFGGVRVFSAILMVAGLALIAFG